MLNACLFVEACRKSFCFCQRPLAAWIAAWQQRLPVAVKQPLGSTPRCTASPGFTTCSGSGQRSSDCVNDRTGMTEGVFALQPAEIIGRGTVGKAIGVARGDVQRIEDAQAVFQIADAGSAIVAATHGLVPGERAG